MNTTKRPTYADFTRFLDRIGVRYYETGILKKGKTKAADYVKCDTLDLSLRQELLTKFGDWVFFQNGHKEYAPEIKFSIIALRSVAGMTAYKLSKK